MLANEAATGEWLTGTEAATREGKIFRILSLGRVPWRPAKVLLGGRLR